MRGSPRRGQGPRSRAGVTSVPARRRPRAEGWRASPTRGERRMTASTADPYLVLRETHCAGLLLVGDRALKFKKPVDLGFLDFTTREKRTEACHREVRLNRRFSPDVYLGVA